MAEETGAELLLYRVDQVEKAIISIDETLKKIVLLDEHRNQTTLTFQRVFQNQEKADIRLQKIELAMPGLQMVKGWIIAGVLGVVALSGTLIWNAVVRATM